MTLASLPRFVELIDRASPFLIDTALKSVVILMIAAIAALIVRRLAAATRHFIWLVGFAGILLLPIASASLPGWHALPRLAAGREPVPTNSVANAPSAPALQETSSTHLPEQTVVAAPTLPDAPISLSIPQASVPARIPAKTPVFAREAAPRAPLPWSFWFSAFWLVGLLIVLTPIVIGHVSLWMLQRQCVRLSSDSWQKLMKQLRQELGIKRTVDLMSHPGRTMPMTWGLFRARLLLPESANEWPVEKGQSVLLHELGHVHRGDCATQLVAQLGCALYWFNPLVWVAWRRMQIERECACDDLVLSRGTKASSYATDLLHIAAIAPPIRFVGAAVAMARPSTLEERLVMILDSKRNRGQLTTRQGAIVAMLLLAALIPVAVLKAQNPATEQPATSPPATPSAAQQQEPSPAGLSAEDRIRILREQSGRAAPAPLPTSAPTNFPSAGGRGAGGRGMFNPTTPLVLGEGPTCTFDVTIYDVRISPEQIGRLDLSSLNRASATPADFEKTLAELGATKPLYRADQSVRLSGDRISIGTQTPYITASTTNRSGAVMNSVNYASVGAVLSLVGKSTSDGNLELDLNIQVSSLSESGTLISPEVPAKVFRSSVLLHKGVVTPRQPFVVLNVDAAQPGTDGKAVAHVARVIVGTPQSPGAPARSN